MSDLLSPSRLLEIMESNRRLTLRTIEAFPEDALFRYRPVDSLRPFAEMVKEILHLELAYVRGVATGEWIREQPYQVVQTKADLLNACGAVREYSRAKWHKVTTERLQAVEADPFFGGGEEQLFDRLFYALENEIHHRGQGFTYLRLLEIEPPHFFGR